MTIDSPDGSSRMASGTTPLHRRAATSICRRDIVDLTGLRAGALRRKSDSAVLTGCAYDRRPQYHAVITLQPSLEWRRRSTRSSREVAARQAAGIRSCCKDCSIQGRRVCRIPAAEDSQPFAMRPWGAMRDAARLAFAVHMSAWFACRRPATRARCSPHFQPYNVALITLARAAAGAALAAGFAANGL